MDAAYEGYGLRPDGKRSRTLKHEPVTIIGNDLCDDILKANNSRSFIKKAKLKYGLNKGVTDDKVCTMGKYDEDSDTFTVSIEGILIRVHC